MWLPKGTALRQRLEDFLKKEQLKRGYQPVITPHIGHKNLYVTSGHWEKYGEDSFQPILTPQKDEIFLLKPMNCPHHCEIFAHRPRSYRELPLRIAEFGTVYRYEQSGELHGLTRVRGFTQDDSHIFCTEDQLKQEFLGVLELTRYVLAKLGFEKFTAQISLRDPENKTKYVGTEENWRKAEQAIIDAAAEVGLNTVTELGEAAFYGPKARFYGEGCPRPLMAAWAPFRWTTTCPSVSTCTMWVPTTRLHRPVMIHRAPFGSMERFTGVLIEHCAGKFPLWLTPEQFAILPVSDKYVEYAQQVQQQLAVDDLRGIVDDRNETIGRKIRDNELKRIPYLLIVGEKEAEAGTVSVRRQGEGDQGALSISAFADMVKAQL
jgi:threonyl-tRNA synthetase